MTEDQIHRIPIVHTDGGCITHEGRKIGAIGVYWGDTSTWNLSHLARFSPFTNQRAEFEAILMALQQAVTRKISSLILLSDSAYAITSITEYRKRSDQRPTVDGTEFVLTNATGQSVSNADLFLRIFQIVDGPIQVYFSHVRRAQNGKADILVNDAYRLAGLKVIHSSNAVTTRQQEDREKEQRQRKEKMKEQWVRLPGAESLSGRRG